MYLIAPDEIGNNQLHELPTATLAEAIAKLEPEQAISVLTNEYNGAPINGYSVEAIETGDISGYLIRKL